MSTDELRAIDRMALDFGRLQSECDELRLCLEQALRRLDKLNEGGPDEADPTVLKIRALLGRTKSK